MPSAERLAEFVAVVEAGSVSEAARARGLPRSTLSRRISALESELGVRLLHRGTRRLVLSPAGEELLRRATKIVADTAEAWQAVRRLDDVPRGQLRVSAGSALLGDMMVEFLVDFPEVELVVHSTTRQLDLVRERIDVALRFGPVGDPSLVARRVASGRRVVVGSPDYLARRGRPATTADLADHECLLDFDGDLPRPYWPGANGDRVAVRGRLAANELSLLHRGALAGLGLALLPSTIVGRDVGAGRLEVLLLDEVGAGASVHLVYPEREYLDPKVRVFIDRAVPFLTQRFASEPALRVVDAQRARRSSPRRGASGPGG